MTACFLETGAAASMSLNYGGGSSSRGLDPHYARQAVAYQQAANAAAQVQAALVFDVARAKNVVLFSVLQNKTEQNVTRWKPAPISKNRRQGQTIKKSTQYDWLIIF